MIALAVSALVAAAIAPGALGAFREAGWTRRNYRDVEVAFPAGVIAVVAGIAALPVLAWTQDGPLVYAPLFLGVAFLGLLDDLFEGAPRGWRGHFGAVLRGGFSTGVLKAAGTLALAVFAAASLDLDLGDGALAVAVIVLTTNLFNLLDLRPGRAWKAWVVLAAGLVIAKGADAIDPVGAFAGALLVVGVFDLRERAMLGDTGSNLLGAVGGVMLVTTLGTTGELVALAVLLSITIFGEFRSISQTVDRVPPLRALDSLGRRDA